MSTYAPSHGKTGTAHPLDPPTPAEIEAAVAAVRADERIGEVDPLLGRDPGRDPRPRGDRRRGRAPHPAHHPGRDAGRRRRGLGGRRRRQPRRAPAPPRPARRSPGSRSRRTVPASPRRRRAPPPRPAATTPTFQAALAKRGIEDTSLVMIDPESIGGFEPEQWKGRRLAWGTVWSKTRRRGQRLRAPGPGRRPDHRPDHDGGARGRGPRGGGDVGGGGLDRARRLGPRAPRPEGARDLPARRHQLRRRRPEGDLAGLGAAGRLHPPRGPRPPRPHLHGPLGDAPARLQRDVRPLPRPELHPVQEELLRLG